MSNFPLVRLGDLSAIKGGKRLPLGKQLAGVPTHHPYIRIRDLVDGWKLNLTKNFEYVDDETQLSIARYIVNSGDVIISIVGTVGLVSIIGDSLDKANLTENCAKIVDIDNSLDSIFLYYYLSSSVGQDAIRIATVGAVQPKLPLKNIQDLSIPLPPLSTQRAIVATLSCLDEAIENNRRLCRTLEATAEAMFEELIANHASHANGWREGTLSDLVDIRYGKAQQDLDNGNIPVYGSGGIMRYANKAIYEDESVLIPRKGTLNNVMYTAKPFWVVDTMFYTVPKIPNVITYVFEFLRTTDLASMNAGTAVPSMTIKILNELEIHIPSANVLNEFYSTTAPMFDEIRKAEQETRTLTAIRDALLPRLLSGEIEVEGEV
jgi:type I restriction enzyme S subunit